MSIYNWGLNNIFMNSFIPMPADPFGGLNPFCTGFGYTNPFLNYMTPQFNIFSPFQPLTMSANSIFTAMPVMNYSMPFMSVMEKFALTLCRFFFPHTIRSPAVISDDSVVPIR